MPELTYITSNSCQPCKTLKPRLDALCKRLGVEIVTLNIDKPEHFPTIAGIGVMGVPTLIIGQQRVEPSAARLQTIERVMLDELELL